jgi:hypothetical protein
MFDDEDFMMLEKAFWQNNPQLAGDSEAIGKQRAKLIEKISDLMEKQPESFESAVKILLQGLNFLARFSGLPEYSMPEMEYQVRLGENFSLIDALPELVRHMHVPQETKVLIIDDIPSEIAGIESILNAWPNIDNSVFILTDGAMMPHVPLDIDILLLDEAMPIKGTKIAVALQILGFSGKIASISSGEKPLYAPWHFGAKGSVIKSYKMAKEFVMFINYLLQS